MAIFEFGSGRDGIKEYLEEGKKQGRELSREQIDQRIILEGDLEICDRLIHSRESEGQLYDHITLSFREKDMTPEMMKAIAADVKEFVSAAYGKDELYVYAEAHMPKTATEQKWNSETKQYETVARYPHIHFIIPRTNLVTGERASVFELLTARYASKDQTMDFTDALQETINEKFGLASPKDHRRIGFVSQTDILSRLKEDVFTGRNREALTMIRDQMIKQNIESPEAFRKMLDGMGVVTEGKGGEYLQIKLPGATQNVRLKDNQFSKEFVSLPMAKKLAIYEKRATVQTAEQKAAAAEERAALMLQWPDRAREIKYLSPSSKFFREQYAPATPGQKTAMLDRLEAAHYAKLEKQYGYVNEAHRDKQRERAAELGQAHKAEVDAYLATPRIEAFTNAKLNNVYLRTTDELRAAAEAGQKILEAPGVVIAALTFSQSHFNEAALERHLLKNTADQEQYDAALRAVLACPELVVHRDDERGLLFTSANIVAIEKSLAERATRMAIARNKAVSAAEQQRLIQAKPFNDGQREAFRLLCSEKQLAVINGAAGTGKSFVLAAMREAYEKEGFTVYGAILQGKTAEDLERDSGIKSRTIAKMLINLEMGTLKFTSKTVIVVDEAGMVGSRDLEKLMAHVEASGARLRLVGDAKQLAAVEYGNAFVEISKRAEVASLTEIMRQKTEWMRQASEKLAVHDITALRDYAEHGRIHFADTTKDAQIVLVEKWNAHRTQHPDQSRIVLAHTNAERIELNDMMRTQLQKEGHLQNEIDVACTRGTVKMAVGEKLMFTSSDKAMGVKNGTTGKIIKISRSGEITVQLDGGKTATFRADGEGTDSGNAVDLAYAVTVHKSQGMTLDKAFVLANSSMSNENLYVAMTRHKHDVDVFASAEEFADVDEMVKTLDRAGQKAFTAGKDWMDAKRPEDSVIGQYIADMNAEKAIKHAAKTAAYKEIAANLEARRVLDYVSKPPYGIDPSKYEIVTDENGKQLIKSGDKLQDAAAFLTKTMHLNYKTEAAPILKQCYGEQLAGIYSEPRRAPGQVIDQSMQREFASHLKARAAQYKAVKETIDQAKRDQSAAITKSDVPEAAKQQAQAELTKAIKAEKKTLKAEHDKPTATVYKDFLAARAPGSAKHLQELSRVSTTPADKNRLALVKVRAQENRSPVSDFSHLTAAQIAKGVSNVLNRTPGKPPAHVLARGIGRPADQLDRDSERRAGTETDRARGVHELPGGGMDGPGPDAGMLLPSAVPGSVGILQAGQDPNVRRAGTGTPGGRSRVIPPRAKVLTAAEKWAQVRQELSQSNPSTAPAVDTPALAPAPAPEPSPTPAQDQAERARLDFEEKWKGVPAATPADLKVGGKVIDQLGDLVVIDMGRGRNVLGLVPAIKEQDTGKGQGRGG